MMFILIYLAKIFMRNVLTITYIFIVIPETTARPTEIPTSEVAETTKKPSGLLCFLFVLEVVYIEANHGPTRFPGTILSYACMSRGSFPRLSTKNGVMQI